MKIKRFFAKDMREALEQVKEHLGPDAVIMSNKKVEGGVEIVAAFDDAASPALVSRAEEDEAVKRELVAQLTAARKRIQEEKQSSASAPLGLPAVAPRFSVDAEDKRVSPVINSRLRGTSSYPLPENRAVLAGQMQALGVSRNASSIDGMRSTDTSEPPIDSLSALLARQQRRRHEGGHTEPPQATRSSHTATSVQANSSSTRSRSRAQENQRVIEQMQAEMLSIRRLLEHQVSNLMWQEMERKEPVRAMLIDRLLKMGFPAELSEQLICYIPENTALAEAWSLVLTLLEAQLTMVEDDLLKRGGVVALIGPTGVGKTTTIAKLAALYAMEYGAEHIALVTTDNYRIGAHEQLATYGRILGCPVRIAKDADELAAVLYQLRHKRFVLLDTAGMGQRDLRLTEQLNTLIQTQGERIRNFLVLPATAQRSVLQETVEHFRRIPLAGTILTKLDESLSLGEVMSVTIQNALPISYITDGQRVPEDIRIADQQYLVNRAAELLDKHPTAQHFWTSEERTLTQAVNCYD
ncbi:MAG: flagellar biosynthesis protein FlhF [Plesiomonas sp.]|uniref:flagellar biosynthesis protein FlhF n=1 Tax=Plesiomonas sp. TaxID=2486279 RepID=UPI003F3FA0D4